MTARPDSAPVSAEPGGAEPVVANGHLSVLRMFEMAYAIDLARAEALWTSHAAGRAERSRLHGTPPKAMAFGVPPLVVDLQPLTLALPSGPCEAPVVARLFDFGVVSLSVRIGVTDLPWRRFAALMNAVDAAIGPLSDRTAGGDPKADPGSDGARPWSQSLDRLRSIVGAALVRPIASPLEEDYLLGVVHAFEDGPTAAELLSRVDLASLLSGEQRPLSDGARADLLRQRFSYYVDDLVVLTWDRAFVYEPRGDSDVVDILEIANAQLLEMRYYDELLDDELPRMYDLVERTRRGLNVFAARRYATLARRLYTLVAEVTELTEKVDNALQVTEDVYLARIYAAALDLYRVPAVSAAVDKKLAIIRDTYTALYDEASSARSELMEAAVVVLIILEVLLALRRH